MASCNIAETESQNFHRIASLLIDSGSKVLRELLMAHVRPSGLSLDQYLLNNTTLDVLQKKKVLNPNQVSLLFPGNKNADLASFDITLLCLLLKNVFGKLPPQELEEIEQLRELRNKVTGHAAKTAIGGSDFSKMWKDISQVIDNLAKCTGDLNFVKEMTDEINDLSLKPKLIPASHYQNLLKLLLEWKNSDQEVKQQIDEVVSAVDVLKKEVEEIKKCQTNRRLGAPGSMPRDLTAVRLENDPLTVTLNWQPPQKPNGQNTAPGSMPRDLTAVRLENDPLAVTLNWQPPQKPNGQITAPGSMPRDLTAVRLENDPLAVTLNWQPPQKPNGQITAPGSMPRDLTAVRLENDPLTVTLNWQPPQKPNEQITAPGSMPRDLTAVRLENDPLTVTLNWQPPQKPNEQITESQVPDIPDCLVVKASTNSLLVQWVPNRKSNVLVRGYGKGIPDFYRQVLDADNIEHLQISKKFVQDKTKQQYVKTELMEGVATMLQTKGSCVISGKRGEGKTLAAASIMKNCFDPDKCLMLNEASDWRFVDVEKTEAIFIDDIFGKYKLDVGRLSAWMPVLEKFAACAGTGNREIKVLITTRGDVLKNCHSHVAHISLFENVIEFSSDKLLDEEKKQMLTMMLEGHKKVLEEPEIERCVKQFTSPIGFPFCCQVFATSKSLFNLGEKFFKNPYIFFKENIKKSEKSKEAFAALVVLFYRGGHPLPDNELLGTNKKFITDLTEISNSLGLRTPLTPSKVRYQLNEMAGIYVTGSSEGLYQFVHNMVAEAVGLLYGESNPEYIIRNCSIDFLHQCVTVPGCVINRGDQDIAEEDKLQVKECYQGELVERLIREVVVKKEVLRTASHPALCERNFLSKFIKTIQSKKCEREVLKSKGIVSTYDRSVYFLSLYAEVVCSDESLSAEDFLSQFLNCLQRCNHRLPPLLRTECWKCKLVNDCMSVCFECGHVKASRTLLQHLNRAEPDSKSLNCAAKGGNFEIFSAVRDQGARPDRDTVTWAAMGGNMDIVKNVLDAGCKPETKTVNWAAWRGNLEIVLAVMEKGAKPDKNTVNCAIEGCSISFSPETSTSGDASKIRGNFEIVKAVLEHGAKPDQETQYRAVRGGNVDIVKAVLDPKHGVEPNRKTANCAVKGGNVDIIRAVLERGAKPGEKTVELAVKMGNAEIINVLSEFGEIPDAETELDS